MWQNLSSSWVQLFLTIQLNKFRTHNVLFPKKCQSFMHGNHILVCNAFLFQYFELLSFCSLTGYVVFGQSEGERGDAESETIEEVDCSDEVCIADPLCVTIQY